MKELSIKEKAKAYDKALERAENEYQIHKSFNGFREMLTNIFPELKESEDECIRKELKALVTWAKSYSASGVTREDAETMLNWLEKQKVTDEEIIFRPVVGTDIRIAAKQALEKIDIGKKVVLAFNGAYIPVNGKTIGEIDSEYDTWLKKQGEQELTNKIGPKFNVGDRIVDNCGYTWKIGGILNQFYILEGVEGGESRPTIEWVNKTFHLWTIQDAKDGDVLASDNNEIVIFKKNSFNEKDLSGSMFVYCNLRDKKGYWYTIGGINPTNYTPATKEQRDLLFTKMKEAGYNWNPEKKELKKISQEYPLTPDECINPWSEEDEKMRNNLIRLLIRLSANTQTNSTTPNYSYPNEIDWLKSLKQRHAWKPSDAQMQALKEACDKHWEPDGLDPLYTLYEHLKELKE